MGRFIKHTTIKASIKNKLKNNIKKFLTSFDETYSLKTREFVFFSIYRDTGVIDPDVADALEFTDQ